MLQLFSSIFEHAAVVGHDRHFQPAHWPELLAFLQATGLRRNEVRLVRVSDLLAEEPTIGGPAVFVVNGKGGKARLVPVLAGREEEVLGLKADRKDEERVFSRIPKHLDVHAYRRQYAPGWTLPSPEGRMRPGSYDPEAVRRVSWALGHNRMDVVLRHYLR
jgi:integrase